MGGVFTRSLQLEDKAVNRSGFYFSLTLAEAKVCLIPPPLFYNPILVYVFQCAQLNATGKLGQSHALDQ
jgi:hypothetical protein